MIAVSGGTLMPKLPHLQHEKPWRSRADDFLSGIDCGPKVLVGFRWGLIGNLFGSGVVALPMGVFEPWDDVEIDTGGGSGDGGGGRPACHPRFGC
jgi:hypothetical protein